jgi:hypothetical protein
VAEVNWVALTVFVVLFGFITWLGFAAAHWRKGDLDLLDEWGLGGTTSPRPISCAAGSAIRGWRWP